MDLTRLMLRLAYWLRHPPSKRTVMIAIAVIVIAAIIVGIEWAGWWPDSLRANKVRMYRP